MCIIANSSIQTKQNTREFWRCRKSRLPDFSGKLTCYIRATSNFVRKNQPLPVNCQWISLETVQWDQKKSVMDLCTSDDIKGERDQDFSTQLHSLVLLLISSPKHLLCQMDVRYLLVQLSHRSDNTLFTFINLPTHTITVREQNTDFSIICSLLWVFHIDIVKDVFNMQFLENCD